MTSNNNTDWILTDEVIFMRRTEDILAIRVTDPTTPITPPTAVLQMRDGILHIDGEPYRTESFYGFLGIFDMFEDPFNNTTIIHHPADNLDNER